MKRTMKKLITLLTVLVMVAAAFAGCAPAAQAPAGEDAQAPAEGDTFKIGIANCSVDEFFVTVDNAFKAAAEKYDNVEIVASFEADYDVQKQLEQVSTLKTMGCDMIVGSIVDTNNAEAIFEAAEGVPQFWVSRHPETEILEKYDYVWFVGSAEKDAGLLQGQFLANYFADKADKTLNYVMLMGPLGYENVNMRTQGAKDALTEAGFTLNAVLEDTCNWERAEAMNKMQQLLAGGKQIDCVICNNDEMALGAVEAMKAINALEGVPVVGVDATVAGCTSVKAGEMAMTVLQNGVGMADKAMELAQQVLAGDGASVAKETWVPFKEVTVENVDNYMK